MNTPDCDFSAPVLQECTPPGLIEATPPDQVLDWPLISLPCIPGFSGTVSVTGEGSASAEGSSDIQLVRDSASECGYRLQGEIRIAVPDIPCVIDADAYEDGAAIRWYNNAGTRTTLNGSEVMLNGVVANDQNQNFIFRFWKCHELNESPDRTIPINHFEFPEPDPGDDDGGSPGHTHSCEKDLKAKNLSVQQLDFDCCERVSGAGWFDCGSKILVTDFPDSIYAVQIDGTNEPKVRVWSPRAEVEISGEGVITITSSQDSKKVTIDKSSFVIEEDDKKCTINLTHEKSIDIKFREVDFCKDGTMMKALVLMSEPYESTEEE